MSVISYSRISSLSQKNGYSLSTQKNIIKEYAQNNNMNILNEYSDIGSGTNMKKLKNLNNLINENTNCMLLVVNIDRFSRNLYDGIEYLNILKSKNIILKSIEQNVSTDNITGLRLIKSCMNDSEFESNMIGFRVKKSLKLIKEKGGHIGPAPFGFKKSRIKNIPVKVQNKNELLIIDLIVNLRLGVSNFKKINSIIKKIKNKNMPSINFYDKNDNIIDIFDKPFTLTFVEIADILNDYEISNRNKLFTSASVYTIFKKNCSKSTINKVKKLKNNLNLVNNFKNLNIN